MKTKLKSILAAALCAVGFAAVPSSTEAQMVTASEAYFLPAKADTDPEDANRSHYRLFIVESADDGDAVLAHAKEKGMSGIDSEKKVAVDSDKLAWIDYGVSEYQASSVANPGIFSPAAFDLADNAYLVIFYHTEGVASEVCVLGADSYDLETKDQLNFDADDPAPVEYNSGWQEMPPKQEVSAVSAEGFLDLTVGDRVAEVPEELVVVDPAWGEAKKATVDFTFGASTVETRTYNCASNDLWETTTLTPGRYTLALTAGADNETAAFWKTGDDWVVFDNSNITADVTFEAGKTYLMLGTNTVDATLTVEDGAKFAYGEGAAGFKGGMVVELPKRYGKKTVGDLYQIYEKIKGSKDNPWDVGVGVEAYTNGTDNLVIVGAGTIADLSEIPADVKGGIAAITVGDGVTDAAAGVFFGFDKVAVTLQENWQGELPDEKSTWHGATNVELTRVPTAVKSVKVQQRYPWNGKVDVDFALSGEGAVKVTVMVTADGKKLKNPTVDGETTFDLGKGGELKDLRLTWDAKADFKDAEKHEKIKVKLSVSPVEAN